MSTYRSNQYRKDMPGFNRRAATRGHFNSDFEDDDYVESDDGIDYVDWDALNEPDWRDAKYTYRIINGVKVHFRDGVER